MSLCLFAYVSLSEIWYRYNSKNVRWGHRYVYYHWLDFELLSFRTSKWKFKKISNCAANKMKFRTQVCIDKTTSVCQKNCQFTKIYGKHIKSCKTVIFPSEHIIIIFNIETRKIIFSSNYVKLHSGVYLNYFLYLLKIFWNFFLHSQVIRIKSIVSLMLSKNKFA